MCIKKEQIGWNIFGKYYKIRSVIISFILFFIDLFGNIFFVLKKRKLKFHPKNILVIRLEHIGDMVLTTTFIYNLKKNYPNSKITLLCRESTKEVAQMIKGVDEIITMNVPWSCREKNCLNYTSILKYLIKNHKKYDLSFDLFFDPRNIILARLLAKFSVGFGVRGFGFLLNKETKWKKITKHIVSRQLDMLRGLNLKVEEKNIPLDIKKQELKEFKTKILQKNNLQENKYTVIHISAGSKARELPLEKWIQYINNAPKNEIIVCSEKDQNKVSYLKSKTKNPNLIFLQLSLKEYIYLIYNSKKVISIESCAIHIASSFNKNVIDLHSAQTLSEEWGPYMNKKAKILQDRKCKYYPCGFDKCIYGYPSKCTQRLEIK